MLRKIFFIASIFILFTGCEYKPIYSASNKSDFRIIITELSGDKKINKFLVSNLQRNSKKNSDKIIKIMDVKKNLGPLGGIFSAMKWVKDNNRKYQWIASFPSDTPFFKMTHLNDFLKRINEKESELFFMKSGEKRHNIFGLWSVHLVDQLDKDLEIGTRKVERWANDIGVKIINMTFEKQDPFFNINTKEDLKKAIEIMKND